MIIKPSKHLGQHFLKDKNIISEIVRAIDPAPGQNIFEIGPGLGALTLPVLRKVAEMHAIEIDTRFSHELLKKCVPAGTLILHQGDVLNFDFNRIADPIHRVRLIGNLPYNISTPLLFYLLRFFYLIADIHFMLQKEVADRIIALPGTSAYSRLSITLQSRFKAESLFDITPRMFSPVPKVNSSFMHLQPRPDYIKQIHNQALFSKLVETAFQQRRKTIKNSLKNMVTDAQLRQASIDPKKRPQEISVQQYINLANQLSE